MSQSARMCDLSKLSEDAKDALKELAWEKKKAKRDQTLESLLEQARRDPVEPYRVWKWYPKYVVWELTLACNMRCEHCGSAAGKARRDELTEDEMLKVCDDLAELGCERVTLLGGEPLIHKSWQSVARRIRDNGFRANVITNGWTLNRPEVCDAIKDVGLTIVGISIDGCKSSHDKLRRREGAFDRILEGMKLLRQREVPIAVSTTLTNDSLNDLWELYDVLKANQVKVWQLQVACPLGRLEKDNPVLLGPQRLAEVYEFARELNKKDDGIHLDLADNVGYYGSPMDQEPGRNHRGTYALWRGCFAGIQAMGIDSNGDIKGCQSHPSTPDYIAGNLRKRPLAEIWNDPEAFKQTRKFTKNMLAGYCADCTYGPLCKAGCTSQAEAWTGNPGNNPMCIHRYEQTQK